MRLAVHGPRAAEDALGELLARLPAETKTFFVREGDEAPPADLSLFDVADGREHAFAFRAARARPGVVLLRDASLPETLGREMADRAGRAVVLREMRRSYGDDGAFVARQVARGLGGEVLPRLFPLTDRLLETCLAVVALTEDTRARVAHRLGSRPSLVLPLHLLAASQPAPALTRDAARRALHLPASAAVVAVDGHSPARVDLLARILARLRGRLSGLRLVVVGGISPLPDRATRAPRFADAALASNVVVALDDPFASGVPAGFEEALSARRALVATAGSPAAVDFAEGTLALVEPGRIEPAHLEAVLERLLGSTDRCAALARLARAEARRLAEPSVMAAALAEFLARVAAAAPSILAAIHEARVREETLLGRLRDEVGFAPRSLGLHDLDLGLTPILEGLLRQAP